MQRYILTIDNVPYLIEYAKSSERTIKHIQEYVMLRRYEITNDIAIDKEIYFAPVSRYNEYIDDEYKETDALVFPYLTSTGYGENLSATILDFVPDATLKTLKYKGDNELDSDIRTDYYNLYIQRTAEDDTIYYERCLLETDVIRIYRPHSRRHVNSIITLSNIINDIRFCYFCERYDRQKVHVSKEIKFNNNYYYEYIEIYVPNVDYLFRNRDIYYNEDLNFYQTVKYAGTKTQVNIMNSDSNKLLLRNLILPYRIEKACTLHYDCAVCPNAGECVLKNIKDEYVRTFVVDGIDDTDYTHSEYNFTNVPFVLTLSHFDYIDESSRRYTSLEGIMPSSVVFSEENQFLLKSCIGFDRYNRSVISVISEWDYPVINNEPITYKFINDMGIEEEMSVSAIQQAYFYYNKITDWDAYFNFTGYDDDWFTYGMWSDEMAEAISKFTTCGCVIEMSLDTRFENVFYRRSAGMEKGIDDFTFNLDNIFYSWREYPEVIFVRVFFVDKFLSKVFFSNIMTLTKEKFKYCINSTFKNYRLDLTEDMETFKFIDKINCTVIRHDLMNEKIVLGNGSPSNKTSIVYKTIFYKTHDTQRIRIRSGVVQNIGINLGEYLSKVENFKLRLEDYEFTESARNDVYVIFKIPATYLTSVSGKYDILDADEDTYITSGDYEVI